MKRKIVWLIGTCLVIISLILVSCGGEEEVTEEEPVTEVETPTIEPPTEEPETPVEEVPQYGGTFAYREAGGPSNWDPCIHATGLTKLWYETLAMPNWMGVSHEEVDFKIRALPISAFTGMLAESWETEDLQTITFHIRKGVHFHDIPPVNGRELTAYDVEYSLHRIFGLGSGFTEPSPYISGNYALIESITATDKYTIAYKFSQPSMDQLGIVLDDYPSDAIIAREAVELWGDVDKFEYQIGTGPFIPEDYVTDASVVAVRNPNYWGYDELYPENRLPYLDSIKILIIPDQSTAFSALRTGKIDRLRNVSWENVESLKRTNPELVDIPYPGRSANCIAMHIDVPPFDDIRVRRAMQMSIDLETIAKTVYGGYVPGTPVGQTAIPGYRADYEEWPQEVKDGYAYNPEGAKQLLAEAGYPNGFKCTMAIAGDSDLWQIIQAYFADVGIDMELEVYEATTLRSITRAGEAVMSPATWGCWEVVPPPGAIMHRTSTHYVSTGQTHINDPFIDELYADMNASLGEEEQMALVHEADMYIISKQWTINILPTDAFFIVLQQPYIKGLPNVQEVSIGQKYARCWIDQDMKKALGY